MTPTIAPLTNIRCRRVDAAILDPADKGKKSNQALLSRAAARITIQESGAAEPLEARAKEDSGSALVQAPPRSPTYLDRLLLAFPRTWGGLVRARPSFVRPYHLHLHIPHRTRCRARDVCCRHLAKYSFSFLCTSVMVPDCRPYPITLCFCICPAATLNSGISLSGPSVPQHTRARAGGTWVSGPALRAAHAMLRRIGKLALPPFCPGSGSGSGSWPEFFLLFSLP